MIATAMSRTNIIRLLFTTIVFLFFFAPAVYAVDSPRLNVSIGSSGQSLIFDPVQCSGGKCRIGWLSQYIGAIYRYGVGFAAVLAVLMIMIGGVVWLTSAGSSPRVSTAKDFITSAITGLVLALFSYTILYTINPALVALKPLEVPQVTDVDVGELSNLSASKIFCASDADTDIGLDIEDGSFTDAGIDQSDVEPGDIPGMLDFDSTPVEQNVEPTALPADCGRFNFTNSYGVDPNILRAIAATESSCNPSAQNTTGGAYGLMQITLPTASSVAGRTVTAEELRNNPQLSIDLAARYIANNQDAHNNHPAHIFAGYNGGYGTRAVNGRSGPLAPSRDCSGVLAYECCRNPGGLAETQGYVVRALSYYEGQ